MNFLAHLWLTDRAGLPLAGAILGDVLHGALPADMPPALARADEVTRPGRETDYRSRDFH